MSGQHSFDLVCPKAHEGSYDVFHEKHSSHVGAIKARCGNCGLSWFVCCTCYRRTRVCFYNEIQLRNHYYNAKKRVVHPWLPHGDPDNDSMASNSHQEEPSYPSADDSPHQTQVGDQENGTVASDQIAVDDQTDVTRKHLPVGPVSNFDMSTTFSREESKLYFSRQSNNLGGISYLSSRSQFGQLHVASDQLDFHEVMLRAITAQLSFYLTSSLTALLERIIKGTEKVVQMRSTNPSSRSHVIELLSEVGSIRRAVMKGRHSFLNILPHLAVRLHKDHAYCLPSDCIADLRAHGLRSILYDPSGGTGTIFPIRGRRETAFMNHLFPSKATIEVMVDGEVWVLQVGCRTFNEFTGDANVNNSNKASSHTSDVWVCIIDLSTHPDDSNNIRYVYPIATGPKTSDHSEVVELLSKDMAQLRIPNLFYDGSNNTFVAEVTKMFVSMQDQIERRPFNHLSAGNARYHARFGYSCDFSSFIAHTVACDDCYVHMRQVTDPNAPFSFRDCDVCTNWLHNMEHPLLRSKAPKEYPVDAPYQEERDGSRFLLPFELSSD
jgi:hypothetical protein